MKFSINPYRMVLSVKSCEQIAGAQRPLVCSKGAVDHRIVHRHANTDINPETSDRHHRSRIDNTEWGRRNAWVGSLMRLRYGAEKWNEVPIDQ